jgi:hypothetical protein
LAGVEAGTGDFIGAGGNPYALVDLFHSGNYFVMAGDCSKRANG